MSIHGGDIAGYTAEYGRTPLDFSANISPLGLPEGVKAAIVAALAQADCYPDPLCGALCAALAGAENLPPEQILCGNGAADLIFRLVLAAKPNHALVLAPTFAEYEQALHTVACAVHYHTLLPQNDFALTESILEAITPKLDMLFLCQPNNPTGQTCPKPLLFAILAACEANGVLLVADECFVDFLDVPQDYSLRDKLHSPNLFILKAFTKLYGMAGVRLGYGLSCNAALLEAMRVCGQPWAVSSLAQAAGVAALEQTDYVARVRALVRRERPWLKERLGALGCRCIGSQANFIFFEHTAGLAEALRAQGVLIRACANYHGLANSYYRVAVRTRAENELLLAAMERCQ